MRTALLAVAVGVALAAQAPQPPATPMRPVVDTIQGVKITDNYRWLENWTDPAVRTWTDAQNDYTRAQLDALPFMSALRARVQALGADTHPRWSSVAFRGGRLFAIKRQPPHEQPMLVVMRSADDPSAERVVVDPIVIDPSGKTAIDFYESSPDGSKVAVSLSVGGNERGDVHVFDVDSGRARADVIPRVNGGTAGGSVAWNADGSGFFYTRYPRPGERPDADLDFYQQLYFHRLGDATDRDTYEIGKDSPKIAETIAQTSTDGRFLLVQVNNGDGGEKAFFVGLPQEKRNRWQRLAGYSDDIVSGVWGKDDALYLLSRKGAPRGQVLRIARSAAPSLADAKVVVPQGDGAIESFVVTRSKIYVNELVGGPSRLRAFNLDGSSPQDMHLPPISSVQDIEALDGDDLLCEMQSYVTPPAYYRVRPGGEWTKTALAVTSNADYSDVAVTRVDATSKDGTRVPLNILMRNGTPLDGRNPTLLYGYGGYSLSEKPRFSATLRAWLEQGGVYVDSNLRGGAEFGDAWHQAGRLTHKQNVFDDFYAAAKYLVDQKYTSPDRLAINGGSNGGLLMGAALTQHPEMYRAVSSHVGIYDMTRFELYPNGAFNVTEFGSVANPDEFRALYAYSPYHRVVDGAKFPAVILFSGTNDPRVNPADSRKFAARLQAATASGRPVLLRISGSGHGFGTSLSEGLSQTVDQYAFLFWQLGMTPKL